MNKEIDSSVKELHRIGELYEHKVLLEDKLEDIVSEEKEELEAQKDNFFTNLLQYQEEQVKNLPKIPENNTIIKKSIRLMGTSLRLLFRNDGVDAGNFSLEDAS